ncbi:transposable element Tc1 transposase [Trichonephila clavipes]|nr:transposable element Tc1 transposase [Trichonephila clavipes]
MPGKRARRHFSQLSELERGLNIGMKTAGWSTRRVAVQVDRSECTIRNCWKQWTREGTHARKTKYGATRKTTRREDRAASTCGPHSDSFNDTSRRTDDNRVRVWRRPGEQYNSAHTVLRHTARTAGVMVWGAIA